MEIRRLARADAEAYRAIRLAALERAPEAFGSVYEAEAARSLESFAERLSDALVVAAFDGSRIVGTAGLRRRSGPKDAHKAALWGVYVEEEWRGRGIGHALVEAAVAAADAGVEQITLAVVVDNIGAVRMYEGLGFVRYGLEPRALKQGAAYSDEALMVRLLVER